MHKYCTSVEKCRERDSDMIKIRRFLGILMTVVMLLSMVPNVVFATEKTDYIDAVSDESVMSDVQMSSNDIDTKEMINNISLESETEHTENNVDRESADLNSENGEEKSVLSESKTSDQSQITENGNNSNDKWNQDVISGNASTKGVTIHVKAPVGSFPEGTRLQIEALGMTDTNAAAEAADQDAKTAAFDISFFNAMGEKIQPANGKKVDVSFDVSAKSELTADENQEASLKVYHISQDGAAELLKTAVAPTDGKTVSLNLEADSFSVYMIQKQITENDINDEVTLAAVQSEVITSIEAQLQDGSGPVGDVGQWQVFRLNAEFELPNDTVHAGDTTVITLPDKLKFNQTAGFDIVDAEGNVVANAVINGGAKTVTLTYTDYAETHSDISGNFFFYVQIDRDKVDQEEIIPLEVDVSGTTVIGDPIHFIGIGDPTGRYLSKSGWQVSSDDKRHLRYQLSVNTIGQEMRNVTITDKIAAEGLNIDHNSLVILKGNWQSVHGDWQFQNSTNVTSDYEVTWNDDGSFIVNLGNIGEQDAFVIRYTAVSDYDLVDGEVIRNDAAIRGDNIQTHTASAAANYYEAGGSAAGYVYTINILKQSEEGDALAGAVFNVVRASNNVVIGTITTDAEGRASISGLLKDRYMLMEVSAPEGYVLMTEPVIVESDDFDADKTVLKTITNESDKTSIPVTKIWDDNNDQDGIRPGQITVKLFANGQDTGNTLLLDENNNWTGAFENLDVYENGEQIIYSLEELNVEGYAADISGDAQTGYTITNTHVPETTEVNGTKTWEDNDDQDGARPESITVRLLANGSEIDSATVTEAENWAWSFADLPKYENGTEINYSVTEDAVADYTTEYNGYDVVNTHAPGKTSVTVTKAWDDSDNQDGLRPESVTVELLTDGTSTGKTEELNAENNWTASFADLDEYSNGQRINYTVKEMDVAEYRTVVTGDAQTGYTITNTHVPETTEVNGTKTWEDNDDQDGARPESITVRLLANGSEIDSATVTEAENWAWSFADLPKYENGTEINYSVTEDAVADYTTEYNGYDVVNTHAPGKTSVTVTKSWNDENNLDGSRPESLTVHLLADGRDTGKTIVLNETNNWTDSFTDLDMYNNGSKIVYTVSEDEIEGYTISITGDAERGYKITNSHTPTTPKDPKKPDKTSKPSGNRKYTKSPKTGDAAKVVLYVGIMILSLAGIIAILFRKRKSIGR